MEQLDLAIKSRVGENTLQRIESRLTNPTIKTLLKITRALNIEFSGLINFPTSKE